MRPKASQQNLHIAGAFANAITVWSDDSKINHESVAHVVKCKGSTSIFSALKVCIPEIVRFSDDSRNFMKEAVSEIELNKFLTRSGYISSRYRNRVKGTRDKWAQGFHRWKYIRWIDPRNPKELRQLRTQLAEITSRFPHSYSIQESELIEFISNLQSINECQPLPPADANRALPAADTNRDDNPRQWEQDRSDFSPHIGANNRSQSPLSAVLQRPGPAIPGVPGAPRRRRIEAIPSTRFVTHRR
jgi:hypothetical protein